ncbi:MAG: hypothetical protein ACOX4H_05200 [Bacillota bacterium]|jgi:hypothetical protein
MAKTSEKNNKKGSKLFGKREKDAPLSLDQSQHEVQSTDIEKTSF